MTNKNDTFLTILCQTSEITKNGKNHKLTIQKDVELSS